MTPIDWKKCAGLIPAIIQDATTARVLMLGYMNEESLELTQSTGLVTFYSRSRQQLWTKGETSGNTLKFVSMNADCDGDTLLIRARPTGPVCHEGTPTCFKQEDVGLEFLSKLSDIIASRFDQPVNEKSYVSRLIAEGLDRIVQKVGEEAVETVIAAKNPDNEAFKGEVADLLFHTLVLLRARGLSLYDVIDTLKARH